MLPKKLDSNNQLSKNDLISYENQGELLLGIIVDEKKGKFIIQNERGKDLELPAQRIHKIPKLAGQIALNLSDLKNQATALAKATDLAEIWEILSSEKRDFSNSEICELLFNNQNTIEYFATRIALLNDQVYFKRRNEDFSPRPAEIVEELLKAATAKKQKEQEKIEFLNFMKSDKKTANASLPAGLKNIKENLLKLVVDHRSLSNHDKKELQQLLNLLANEKIINQNARIESLALACLEKAELIDPDINLAVIAYDVATEHSKQCIERANAIAEEKFEIESWRKDLRNLETFTIDGIGTKDMDDALSLEYTAEGLILGIHITDVAHKIESGTALDLEIRDRGTSHYFFDATINMFPESLATETFSLKENTERKCISYMIELAKDYSLIKTSIYPSVIKLKKNYSYNEVNDYLESSDRIFSELYNLAGHFEAERITTGSGYLQRKEIVILRNQAGEIYLEEIDEKSPARYLVSEMMIKANHLSAIYCADNKIPALYRGQAQGEQIDVSHIPEGPARDYAARSTLKPSSTTPTPNSHATLGLDAYLQATSPIRRYGDIINQRQILNFLLHGKSFYTKEDILSIQEELDYSQKNAQQCAKARKRYWLCRYLEQLRKQNQTIEAVVLRADMKLILVELQDVFMPVLIQANGLKPGDHIKLRVQHVNPLLDELKLDIVR